MKKCLLFAVLTICWKPSFQQTIAEIRLQDQLRDKYSGLEFSSLARWKDKILLIPAGKDKQNSPVLYAIDTSEIDKGLNNRNYKVKHTIIKTDSESAKKFLVPIKQYDGFEAAVVIDSTIYFAVETKGDHSICYIIKGQISQSVNGKISVRLSGCQPILKACGDRNSKDPRDAGFESLTYYNGRLWAIFEYEDKCSDSGFAYTISPNLDNDTVSFSIPKLYNRRLADITTYRGTTLLGLNTTYGSNPRYDIVQIKQSSITSIFNIATGTLSDNWEGMTPYRNGILIINDNTTGVSKDKTRLKYIDFTGIGFR